MAWLKEILDENRRTVASWPEWKREAGMMNEWELCIAEWSQRTQILEAENARLKDSLRDLHALVKGECPSLLNEDSGGDRELDLKIEAALREAGS